MNGIAVLRAGGVFAGRSLAVLLFTVTMLVGVGLISSLLITPLIMLGLVGPEGGRIKASDYLLVLWMAAALYVAWHNARSALQAMEGPPARPLGAFALRSIVITGACPPLWPILF